MKWILHGMLPMEVPIVINLPVLMFSMAVVLVTGISCVPRPALEFSRPVATQMLADSTRSTIGSAGHKPATGTPTSACFNTPTKCSTENFFFMAKSPLSILQNDSRSELLKYTGADQPNVSA